MATTRLPQTWLPDLVIGIEQQAPGDVGKQAGIIGRTVGELIERIYKEDPKRGVDILVWIERAVKAGE